MAFSLLGRLLDIEWLLLRDEGRRADELAAHDRELLGDAAPADTEAALSLWLERRRGELHGRTLGTRVSEVLTLLHVSLVAMSAAAGAGAAGALLRGPDAREPTNVLHFMFATLLWPLILLLGSMVLLSWRGGLARSVLLEDLYVRALGLLGRWTKNRSSDDWDLAREWRRLRRSGRRYRDLEMGTLVSAAQWYPLSYHLGAALGLAASALFSDLAFAWSTTQGSLDAATLAAVFGAATAPWCAPLHGGCVSGELVRATQFSRFTGEYALPSGAALSGAWWPALFGCLLVYGVLPRLLLSLGLRAFVGRRAARLSERVLELRGRLRPRLEVLTDGSRDRLAGAPAAPEPAAHPPALGGALRECWLICWRGAPVAEGDLAAPCERLGLEVMRRDVAGNGDFAADEALLGGSSGRSEAVLLVVEGWEAPDKATRGFVQTLRRQGRADRPIFVGVLVEAADARELSVWRDRLRLLEDPWLGVEPIVTAPRAARVSGEASR